MKPYTLKQLADRLFQLLKQYKALQEGVFDLPRDEYDKRQILIQRNMKRYKNITAIMRRVTTQISNLPSPGIETFK